MLLLQRETTHSLELQNQHRIDKERSRGEINKGYIARAQRGSLAP
jgi:hypothetical protein